ncbi:MAG: histone deacetylase [Dehalococcoidia bacterium]
MTTAFVTDALFLEHRNDGHPERPERLRAILEQLQSMGLRSRMVDLEPRDATDDEIRRVHSARVIEWAHELAAAGGGWADLDTYVNAESPAVARRAAGGVLAATQAVLRGEARNAFAAVRPPGHHATPRQLMGFCLLNNVAIAAGAALDAGVARVAIVDWDVHHGNGTQAIFDADPRVLYFSTHASPFYPGTGRIEDAGIGWARGTKLNAPLPPGTGDAGFLEAYARVCVPALERFRPELMLVSSGWDAHARDPLAPLLVSTAGYTEAARMVLGAADALCDGRVVATLEGGYDERALAWCASALCELLLGIPVTPDSSPVSVPASEPDVTPMVEALRR